MSSKQTTNIPHFIRARSPKRLRSLMLKNNNRFGMIFNYYQIVWDGKAWYAWYMADAIHVLEAEANQPLGEGEE